MAIAPLVERQGRSDFEVAVQEIVEGKITLKMAERQSSKAAAAEALAETAD